MIEYRYTVTVRSWAGATDRTIDTDCEDPAILETYFRECGIRREGDSILTADWRDDAGSAWTVDHSPSARTNIQQWRAILASAGF